MGFLSNPVGSTTRSARNMQRGPAKWFMDDVLGNDPDGGDSPGVDQDNTRAMVEKVNERFGVGDSMSARNTKSNFQSAMERYRARFLAAVSRQAVSGAGQEQAQVAQQSADRGFAGDDSMAMRGRLDAAGRAAQEISGRTMDVQRSLQDQERSRNQQRLALISQILGGNTAAFDEASMLSDETNGVLGRLPMELVGNTAVDVASTFFGGGR
jgi:hypothetical protein